MTSGLRECPFCGGEARKQGNNRNVFWVECSECMNGLTVPRQTEAEAIDAWNTRAERTCRMIDNGVELCCSECDARHDYNDEPDYCMGCGAKVVEHD